MSDPEQNPDIILREHTYDGIEEYDQKLPNWWLFTLYITIVAFVIWWVAYYQLPFGIRSDTEKIEAKIAAIDAERDRLLQELIASMTDDSLREMADNPDHVAAGRIQFEQKCALCHGPDLSGMKDGVKLPGVSLVDAEWLHGKEPLKIMNTITNGAPDPTKGMIAWKTQLTAGDIAKITAYIISQQPDS